MTVPPPFFDELYAGSPDPWGFRGRWYERRKYALTLAALPEERYANGVELGCSIGVLTALLAQRCEALLAVDCAAAAVERAAVHTTDAPGVTVEQRGLPAAWPAGGPFDLVVASELLYYFDDADRARLLDLAVGDLVPGGTLLVCHWLGDAPSYPVGGAQVHDEVRARRELDGIGSWRERQLALDVLVRRP